MIWAILNKSEEFSFPHMIFIHMCHMAKRKTEKLPYGALVTRIFKYLKIDYFGVSPIVMQNVEIGKKTLDKMMFRMMSDHPHWSRQP